MLDPLRETRAVGLDLRPCRGPFSATERIHDVHIRDPCKQDPCLEEQPPYRGHHRAARTCNVIGTDPGGPFACGRPKPSHVVVIDRLDQRRWRRDRPQRRVRLPLRKPCDQAVGLLIQNHDLARVPHPHRMRMLKLKPVPGRGPLPPWNRIHPAVQRQRAIQTLQSNATVTSTSTGESSGRTGTPTAERA